jgi:coenzyme F420-0:L-glutamate ligase
LRKVELLPLKLPIVRSGDDLARLLVTASKAYGGFQEGDILVVCSKAVSISQGRIIRLEEVGPSKRARELSKKTGLEPPFVELVLREADAVLGASDGVILTIKDGMPLANAGIDHSNSPPGTVSLLPTGSAARKLRERIHRLTGRWVGVIISDSVVKPLRRGTVGQAIQWAGVEPVEDCRGRKDLFGRRLQITFRCLVDQLASAAELLMGESNERTPAVIVRGSGLTLTHRPSLSPRIPPRKCLYFSLLKETASW